MTSYRYEGYLTYLLGMVLALSLLMILNFITTNIIVINIIILIVNIVLFILMKKNKNMASKKIIQGFTFIVYVLIVLTITLKYKGNLQFVFPEENIKKIGLLGLFIPYVFIYGNLAKEINGK